MQPSTEQAYPPVAPSLFVAINEASGTDAQNIPQTIKDMLEAQGHHVTMLHIPAHQTFEESCTALVREAAQTDGIVVAAGGDGTVNGIAKLCYQHNATFAVIPLGTFNYFAHAIGIPPTLEEAVKTLSDGVVQRVSAGFVHEHLFLNNASFGLYPKLIRKREKATATFGRKRIVGAVSAFLSLLERQKVFSITWVTDSVIQEHRTTMVFVGNNSYQLENLGLDVSACAKQDRLAVVMLKPLSRLGMARLIWRGIVKNLHFEEKLIQQCADRFEVKTRRKHIQMVIDGEIITCATPLQFRVEADALHVISSTKR